jgi:hypothetical protein
LHGGVDVGQGLLDAGLQRRLAVGADRFEHHLDHRFPARRSRLAAQAGAVARDLDDRVEHRAHRQTLVGDLAHDAVDQEGAVVLDDLQSVEAGAGGVQGRGDPHQRRAAATAFAEAPEVGEILRQLNCAEFRQLVGDHVSGGLLRESADGGSFTDSLGDSLGQDGGGGWGAPRFAHRRASIWRARTPPEESVRRRAVPPWGGGGTLGARCVRGLGGRTHLSRPLGSRLTLHRFQMNNGKIPSCHNLS